MTELTSLKVSLVMQALEMARAEGKLGWREPVPPRAMARYSVLLGIPLDEKTFRNAERRALEKLREAIQVMGHESRVMSKDASNQKPLPP